MSAAPVPRLTRRRGFTPFPNEVLMDWPRLLSGDAQVFSVMLITSETLGAVRDRGTAPPEWTRPISTEELAEFCHCTTRAVQLALDDLAKRKVIKRKSAGRGAWQYNIPFETWANLPDRPPKVVAISEAEEPEEETAEETPAPATGETIAVFDKPQRLKRGAKPRAKELPKMASKLRVTSNGELEYMAHLTDGLLSIELNVPAAAAKTGESKANAQRNAFRSGSSNSKKTKETGVQLDGFADYERACERAGMAYHERDLQRARAIWARMTPEDRGAATVGLIERRSAGEFGLANRLPQNFLRDQVWKRAVRKPARATTERTTEAERREHYAKMMDMARRMDAAAAGGKRGGS